MVPPVVQDSPVPREKREPRAVPVLRVMQASLAATELPAAQVLLVPKANPALLAQPSLVEQAQPAHQALLVAMALLAHPVFKVRPAHAVQLAHKVHPARTADQDSPEHLA